MSEHTLCGPIEAILMVASEPVGASELADVLGVTSEEVDAELHALAAEYLGEGQEHPRGFELREVAGASIPLAHTPMLSAVSSSDRLTPASRRRPWKRWPSSPTVSRFHGRESPVFVE